LSLRARLIGQLACGSSANHASYHIIYHATVAVVRITVTSSKDLRQRERERDRDRERETERERDRRSTVLSSTTYH